MTDSDILTLQVHSVGGKRVKLDIPPCPDTVRILRDGSKRENGEPAILPCVECKTWAVHASTEDGLWLCECGMTRKWG